MSDSEAEATEELSRLEKSNEEIDKVYRLLEKLDSPEDEERAEAQKQIDEYLKEKKRRSDEEILKKTMVAGCLTTSSRTLINNEESEGEKRRLLSEEFKAMGNEAFRDKNFTRAIEYYTSAILQNDQNPVLFTNRAQAQIKLGRLDDAIDDCRMAIKLDPLSTKANVHLAKALQGKKEYKKALQVLEIAEENCKSDAEIIRRYKAQVITDMKKHLLETV